MKMLHWLKKYNNWKKILKSQPTEQKFNTRLREHQKAVEQEHPKKSALAEHSLQSGHTNSWESSVILRTSPGWRTRRLLEAWEINTCKSALNRDHGMCDGGFAHKTKKDNNTHTPLPTIAQRTSMKLMTNIILKILI